MNFVSPVLGLMITTTSPPCLRKPELPWVVFFRLFFNLNVPTLAENSHTDFDLETLFCVYLTKVMFYTISEC